MINVAIDGPAGAGKSTIAKKVAKDMDFIYVDTGAMFRAIGLFMIENGTDLNDEAMIAKAVPEAEVDIRFIDGIQCVILNGTNVNDRIRTDEVSNAASKVAVVKEVRAKMLSLQRSIAANNNVIMDGRDIGSKVLPDAQLKIYLTASVDVRADRRYKENISKGYEADLETIKQDIRDRDHRDMTRKEAPLIKTEDAVEIDSSYMSVDEVVKEIEELIKDIG